MIAKPPRQAGAMKAMASHPSASLRTSRTPYGGFRREFSRVYFGFRGHLPTDVRFVEIVIRSEGDIDQRQSGEGSFGAASNRFFRVAWHLIARLV